MGLFNTSTTTGVHAADKRGFRRVVTSRSRSDLSGAQSSDRVQAAVETARSYREDKENREVRTRAQISTYDTCVTPSKFDDDMVAYELSFPVPPKVAPFAHNKSVRQARSLTSLSAQYRNQTSTKGILTSSESVSNSTNTIMHLNSTVKTSPLRERRCKPPLSLNPTNSTSQAMKLRRARSTLAMKSPPPCPPPMSPLPDVPASCKQTSFPTNVVRKSPTARRMTLDRSQAPANMQNMFVVDSDPSTESARDSSPPSIPLPALPADTISQDGHRSSSEEDDSHLLTSPSENSPSSSRGSSQHNHHHHHQHHHHQHHDSKTSPSTPSCELSDSNNHPILWSGRMHTEETNSTYGLGLSLHNHQQMSSLFTKMTPHPASFNLIHRPLLPAPQHYSTPTYDDQIIEENNNDYHVYAFAL